MHRIIKAVTVTAVASVVALAFAGIAAAEGPTNTHYTHYPSGSYIDDTVCSFPVTVNGWDTFTEHDFPDGTIVFNDTFHGTVTANGVTLEKSEAATITWAVDGSETWNGLAESYSYQDGPVIAADRGVVVFDADGNIVEMHGPHPIILGPGTDAVCGVLAGS